MGMALYGLARYEWDAGQEPSETLARAVGAYVSAASKNPRDVHAHGNLGIAHAFEAECELNLGTDPRDAVQRAIEASHKALELKPDHYSARTNVAHAYWVQALYELDNDLDPGPSLRAGRTAIGKGLEINPSDALSHYVRGRLLLLEGRWNKDQGRDPAALFDRADAALRQALALDPESADFYLELATLERSWAEWLSDDEAAHERIDSGLELVEDALAINLTDAAAIGLRGELLLLEARFAPSPDRKAELLQRAEDSLSRALEINPNFSKDFDPLLREARSLLAEVD